MSQGREYAPTSLDDPVLNGPTTRRAATSRSAPKGPTGEILEGRRPSESFIPVAPVRKRGRKRAKDGPTATAYDGDQLALALYEEQVQKNTLINGLRYDVEIWRASGYKGATATSLKLLRHWADPDRDNRILFAQREAAETAIFLAEVSGRHGFKDRRPELGELNSEHNLGLPRIALKMATGSGKTVVMAMLIAWQTLNKIATPTNPRYAKRFLVVTPGITIRDRLRVLQPNDRENYYDQRGLVPADLRGLLGRAQILITNYHAFIPKDRKEFRGVASMTKQILLAGKNDDPFKETDADMVSRVLRGWGVGTGQRQSEIVVLNDEAHHCYMDKPITVEDEEEGVEEGDKEDRERNIEARVWFKGLQAVAAQGRRQGHLRHVCDTVLPRRVRPQGRLHLPVDGQRLLSHGCHRVRHRQGPPHPGRRQRRRRHGDLPQPVDPDRQEAPQTQSRRDPPRRGPPAAGRARGGPVQPLPVLRARVRALARGPRTARRAAAGLHRGLPEHGRVQARLRLDRRRGRPGR